MEAKMTVEEIKQEKRLLALEIKELLDKFKQTTGLNVESIDLKWTVFDNFSGDLFTVLTGVTLDIERI